MDRATRSRFDPVSWATFTLLIAVLCPPAAYGQCIGYGSKDAEIVGSIDTPGRAFGVAVSGRYVFVADNPSGLQVVDVSNPANPVIVGNADTPGVARGVAVSASYVYVADGTLGLQVVDVSNPANPVIVGRADTPDLARAVALSGSYVYVADYTSGLQVVDVSNPANPVIVGSADTLGRALSVAVWGSYAYVTGHVTELISWLQVVDVSNPTSPLIVGSIRTGRPPWSVAVWGNYAYVAATSGLHLVNVSDPPSPASVGFVDTPGSAFGVAVSGRYAYVADDQSGLLVLDVSDPAFPWIIGGVDTPGEASGVTVSGSYAYVADGTLGLQVAPAQCEEPVTPSEMLAELASLVSSLDLPAGIEQSLLAKLDAAGRAYERGNDGAARGQLNAFVNQVNAQGGRHIADEDADALIQQAEAIMSLLGTGGGPFTGGGKWRPAPQLPDTFGALRLSTSGPNPLDRSTMIRFELPRLSLVALAVYDIRGRRVRSFQAAATPAGSHVIQWDGRDGAGSRVAAGVYFVRLVAEDRAMTRRMVVLK